MQCFLKSQYIKSRTFNDKNRSIIKKVMVLKKLLPHLATRGTYSPGDWRCDEAWHEQTLVYPQVICQQRLSYCTWELNVMHSWPPVHSGKLAGSCIAIQSEAMYLSTNMDLKVELFLVNTGTWYEVGSMPQSYYHVLDATLCICCWHQRLKKSVLISVGCHVVSRCTTLLPRYSHAGATLLSRFDMLDKWHWQV